MYIHPHNEQYTFKDLNAFDMCKLDRLIGVRVRDGRLTLNQRNFLREYLTSPRSLYNYIILELKFF